MSAQAQHSQKTGPNATVARDIPLHALVVDDSDLQRRILASFLTRWGFRVSEAASGQDALALCTVEAPDLVLSDWMMPGMDGLAFCRAFRALPRESYGYFILLTSKSGKEAVALGLDCGADDFLTKPVNPAELRARINAGTRIIDMQRQLSDKNRLITSTLAELQALYDALDTDLAEAKKLQQSLVRERSHDFGAAQVCLLLRSSGHVGGDLVGFYPAGDTHAGLFALDVSGHGISSAMMTARLASYMSSSAPEHNIALTRDADGLLIHLPPEQVAGSLNRLVLQEVQTDHYLTLFLADADLQTGRVVMVQAGHPNPMVQRRDGTLEILGAGGLPVGLFDSAVYQQFDCVLAPGDRLIVLSDGILECPDPHDRLLGTEGASRMLEDLHHLAGTAFLEAIIWNLTEYAGGHDFPDDVSAVLFEYKGAPQSDASKA